MFILYQKRMTYATHILFLYYPNIPKPLKKIIRRLLRYILFYDLCISSSFSCNVLQLYTPDNNAFLLVFHAKSMQSHIPLHKRLMFFLKLVASDRMAQLTQSFCFNLPYPLTGNFELKSHFFKSMASSVMQPEA